MKKCKLFIIFDIIWSFNINMKKKRKTFKNVNVLN